MHYRILLIACGEATLIWSVPVNGANSRRCFFAGSILYSGILIERVCMAFFRFFFKSLWGPQVLPVRPGNPSRWRRLIGPAAVLLAAAVAITPLLIHGPSCGHDFDFH